MANAFQCDKCGNVFSGWPHTPKTSEVTWSQNEHNFVVHVTVSIKHPNSGRLSPTGGEWRNPELCKTCVNAIMKDYLLGAAG